MILCKDCRHFGANAPLPPARNGVPVLRQPGDSQLCLHPSTISEIDPTDGTPRRYSQGALAYNQRQFPAFVAPLFGRCGTRARFFEAKEEA